MTIEERLKNTIKMLNYVSSVEKPDGEEWRQILTEIIKASRQDGVKEEREACAKIAHDEAMKWGMDLNGRTAGLHIEGEIRARSS